MDAKLYYGDQDAELAAMTEADNVKDVTVNLEAAEWDGTTRANSGWRSTVPTLKTCTIEFEMNWEPDDAAFQAVRDAFLNGTGIELAALSGDRDTADSEGPKGTFSITSFPRSEPLEEGISVAVTAKLAVWDEWVEVAS